MFDHCSPGFITSANDQLHAVTSRIGAILGREKQFSRLWAVSSRSPRTVRKHEVIACYIVLERRTSLVLKGLDHAGSSTSGILRGGIRTTRTRMGLLAGREIIGSSHVPPWGESHERVLVKTDRAALWRTRGEAAEVSPALLDLQRAVHTGRRARHRGALLPCPSSTSETRTHTDVGSRRRHAGMAHAHPTA